MAVGKCERNPVSLHDAFPFSLFFFGGGGVGRLRFYLSVNFFLGEFVDKVGLKSQTP